MRHPILAKLSYLLIFLVQVPIILIGIDWYPQLLMRMMEWRQAGGLSGSETTLWTVTMAVIVCSPVLILVTPYRVAWSFWNRARQLTWQDNY
jgi:hypothetical protein